MTFLDESIRFLFTIYIPDYIPETLKPEGRMLCPERLLLLPGGFIFTLYPCKKYGKIKYMGFYTIHAKEILTGLTPRGRGGKYTDYSSSAKSEYLITNCQIREEEETISNL
jgi:hypothetical protein